MTARSLVLTLALAVSAGAQTVPVPRAEATADPAPSSHVSAMLQSADASLKDGAHDAAAQSLLMALAHHPWSPAVLRRLVAAAGDDADARLLWAHAYQAAIADARGNAKLDRETAKLLEADTKELRRLSTARAQAAQELAKLVKGLRAPSNSNKGEEILARWAAGVAAEVVRPAPALATALHETFAAAEARQTVDPMSVVQALRKLMTRALQNRELDVALKAGALLRGLGSQARQHDLRGPEAPALGDVEGAAAQAQAQVRQLLGEGAEVPLTVTQLLDMTDEERAGFTATHGSLSRPGRAVSPSGRYLIETVCGHETLLGVARTIEFHHDRLAGWYGSDPFDDRQGLVRVLPEHHGLEGEGTPYWWAGGFQSGDVTTVRFACSTIHRLGRVLTHELTHRFDGVLRPFQPSWLVEGKAVWTGGAYAATEQPDFVDRYANPGSIQAAFIAGYGRARKLQELIEGKIEDYRDNYTAGFALFVYLWSWKNGDDAIYRERFRQFQHNGRAGQRRPFAFFCEHFADGEDGRPADFDAFVARFAEFLQGFYWKSRAGWVERYALRLAPPQAAPYVYDEPTWTWSRERAEPFFGQDHASLAGDLLYGAGDRSGATAAYLWARRVDEPTPERTARLEELLGGSARSVAAWALRRDPEVPVPGALASRLPRLRALMTSYEEVAGAYRERGLTRAATVLEADRRRIARALGPLDPPIDPPAVTATPRHPFDDAPMLLGSFGWVEDALTGYDKRRAAGMWYEADGHDLHVGRARPREKSGLLDRRAYERPVFVRGMQWMAAGRYAIRTKVYLTTSYARAALVFGYTRRDRNVRLRLEAGDFLYATGEKKAQKNLEEISVQLSSTWIRDGHLWGAAQGKGVPVRGSAGGIDLEVLVDGAEAQVFGNGEYLFSFHTPDGSPIEGHVGFAAETGALRLQEPTVQRLERSAVLGLRSTARRLDPQTPVVAPSGEGDVEEYLNKSCSGIPRHPQGTIVLWIPDGDFPGGPQRLAQRASRSLAAGLQRDNLVQSVVVMVPEKVPADARTELLGALRVEMSNPCAVQTYREAPPELADDVWALFVDGQGALRVAAIYVVVRGGYLPRSLRHWAKAYRRRR